MKKLKKVIAVLVALLIVARIVLMGASAAFVGTATMVGIVAILAAALVSSGQFTQSQVNSMSNNDIISSYRISVESGAINPKERIKLPDGVTYEGSEYGSVVDYFFAYDKFVFDTWKYHVTEGWEIIDNAIDDWLTKWYQAWNNEYTDVEDIVKPMLKGDINMMGHGALCEKIVMNNGSIRLFEKYYCDYIVISYNNDNTLFSLMMYNTTRVITDGTSDYFGNYGYGWFQTSKLGNYVNIGYGDSEAYFLYGDVRLQDGTKVETNDEYEYPLGETEDGTKVTVDMLNPDATVTVDGVTEKPSDYINIEYYTDPAVIDLLQQILNALDKANVVAPDDTKDIVDEISGAVSIDVPEELTDYVVPTGIISVFPFCIPVDIYRGFVLLSRPAVAPKIEIPFNIPAFGLFEGVEKTITLDFSKYDNYIKIFRWFQIFGFGFLLCSVSFKKVKGV